MRTFSTGDVREITGMRPTTFEKWCHKQVVQGEGGIGSGNHRRFTLMQVVGILIGQELRKHRGCHLRYVGEVVAAFDAMTEAELISQFERNKTHFVMVHQGKPWMESKKYDWPDVQSVYRKVKHEASMIAEQAANTSGRNRGLVGARY